jgi:hypothetical protein
MEAAFPVQVPLRSGLTLYMLGQESTLFSRRSRQLYGLDCTATVALLRLAEGEEPRVVSRYLGLEGGSVRVVSELADILAGNESSGDEYESILPCPAAVPDHGAGLPLYRLLDTTFAVEGPCELLRQWITPFVAHLRLEGMRSGVNGRVDLLVGIEAACSGWIPRLNGAPQAGAMPAERLLPLIYDRLRKFAYQSCAYLLTVHGAVVTRKGHTLILAGRSGSGKSTLAAALLARGYTLISDEPAVIEPHSRGVLPVPFGLGLKEGSWPAALRSFPGFDHLPVHIRFDGRRLRYLLPDGIEMAVDGAIRLATHLIFPCFGRELAGKIEPLSPVQALRTVAEAGYQVPGLDEDRVARILQWLGSMYCYSLTYSSTAEALGLLGEVAGIRGE